MHRSGNYVAGYWQAWCTIRRMNHHHSTELSSQGYNLIDKYHVTVSSTAERARSPLAKHIATSLATWSIGPEQWLLLSLCALGVALRLYGVGAKTVWLDEAFSIWLANQPLTALWSWLVQIDQHPPLYYTLLHLWQRFFGDLQGTVRLLSVLFSGLTLPLIYDTTRRLTDRATALCATLLLAISPFHVRYAQEARMYALLTLTVALALNLLLRVLLLPPTKVPRQRLLVASGLAQATVMLTHNTATVFYPVLLNLVICGVWLWHKLVTLHSKKSAFFRVFPRPKELFGVPSDKLLGQTNDLSLLAINRPDFGLHWAFMQGIALLGWLPWTIPFVIQSIGVDREFWMPAPTWTFIRETLHTFYMAFQPATPIPWLPVDLLYLTLFLLGIWRFRTQGSHLALLLALCLGPILLALFVSLRRPIFFDRIFIWATIPYFVLIAAGLMQVHRWSQLVWRQWASCMTGLLLLSMILLSGQALHNYYTNYEKEEWDRAAALVATQIEENDLILFNATWVQLPFVYYFRHHPVFGETVENLHGLPVDLFDRGVLEPKMTTADIPRLEQLIEDHPRVWLIYSHDWYTDPQGIIPRELKNRRRLVAHHRFYGLQVMEFVGE